MNDGDIVCVESVLNKSPLVEGDHSAGDGETPINWLYINGCSVVIGV